MPNSREKISPLEVHYGDYLERPDIKKGFPGGFLNLGYWKRISPNCQTSLEQRIESQREMYRIVLERLDIHQNDSVLEIASGRGVGCALALEEFDPARVCGVDIMPIQIERSKSCNADALRKYPDKLNYRVGTYYNIPHSNESFDKVFSVEAFGYFTDIDACMRELRRVSRRPAVFSTACVFATSSDIASEDWLHLFDRSGQATGFSASDVTTALAQHGFSDVNMETIGDSVWAEYREWTRKNFNIENPMPERWYRGYKEGLFDYYLISANLPS